MTTAASKHEIFIWHAEICPRLAYCISQWPANWDVHWLRDDSEQHLELAGPNLNFPQIPRGLLFRAAEVLILPELLEELEEPIPTDLADSLKPMAQAERAKRFKAALEQVQAS